MSQENASEQHRPDCLYPAFGEVSIEEIERGTILSLKTLLNYLHYVRNHELQIPNPLHPTLASACELIIKLLTKTFPLSIPLQPSEVYALGDNNLY
jgi:hypothetical protein